MDPQAIQKLMTRLNSAYGTPRLGLEAVEIKALMQIPPPPDAFVEMRCAVNGLYDFEREQARRAFFQRLSEVAGVVKDYQAELLKARNHNVAYAEFALAANKVHYAAQKAPGQGLDPIEYIVEPGATHAQWMLLVDIDFRREYKRLKRQPVYIRLYPGRLFSRSFNKETL